MFEPVKKYFDLNEFVCPDVYKQYNESAWIFLDDRLLETVYIIRDGIGKSVTANDWSWGGSFTQRGLRCNTCALVKEKTYLEKIYLTAHSFGLALDFHVSGMSANEVRLWILEHESLLPYPIRLEVGFNPKGLTKSQLINAIKKDTMNWVHIDLRSSSSDKISFFKE